MSLDYLSELSEKLIPIGVFVGMIVGLMRWLYGISIRRQLDAMKTDILRALKAQQTDHEQQWHGRQPPPTPMPTWHRPDPNGNRPSGAHRAERSW